VAKKSRFIDGIFNYCDRWCERCPFTARCRLFADEQRAGGLPKDMDADTLVKHLKKSFARTRKMIEQMAAKHGIDLDALKPAGAAEERRERQRLKTNPVGKASEKYALMVNAWFKKYDKLFERTKAALVRSFKMELPGTDPEGEARDLADICDIIRWYQYQIHVKLVRAWSGLGDEEVEGDDGYPRDSDGSAKVALLAIDRSLDAWLRMREHFPEKEKSILRLLVRLERLRRAAEAVFPRARAFHRPGFDDADAVP